MIFAADLAQSVKDQIDGLGCDVTGTGAKTCLGGTTSEVGLVWWCDNAGFLGWWRFPRLRGFGENVPSFIPRLYV